MVVTAMMKSAFFGYLHGFVIKSAKWIRKIQNMWIKLR
ncbi:hypothetical protein AC58_5059 [Escherichia coli 3-105-05_S3_C3]|nr:hypothetical protein AC58_5059 [Escherichia coli 3-105-05_S3_C3]